MARLAMRTLMRAAAVQFLDDLRTDLTIPLQVFRARPASIKLPCAFIDRLTESIDYTALNQRKPQAEIVVLHGLFDSGEAVDQADVLADALVDIVFDGVHQIDPTTTVAVTSVEDDPTYVPEWLAPEYQRTYYATRFTLEGLSLSG
jgi:hypothetical protein